MKIKVLGCHGGQLPGFNSAGFLLDGNILIDAGTIASKLPIKEQRKIRAVLVSHAHLDHVGGLPLFSVNITSNKAPSVEIATTAANIRTIKGSLMNGALWPDFSKIRNAGRNPVFKYTAVAPGKWRKIGGIQVKYVKVKHTVPACGIIFGKGGRFAVYTGDTKDTNALWAEAKKLGKKLKAVFIEVAYPDRLAGLAGVSAHLVPSTAAGQLKKLGSLKPKVYAMHMKPEYLAQIKRELKKHKITAMAEGKTYKI